MGAADGSIFSRHLVDIAGYQVPYLRGGRGEPLVYLHGLGGAGKWESYHMALANDTLTYAPQLPGWQDWTPPAGIESVAAYAQIVIGFLDALDAARVTLVGHSIGGWIAQYVAVAQPNRVARLILVDSLGVQTPDALAVDLEDLTEETFARALLAKLGLVASGNSYGFGAEFTNVRASPDFERQWKGRGLVGSVVRGPCADPALVAKLGAISAETLVVWGELDGLAPLSHGLLLRDGIANSRLAVLQAAGHLPMIEKREAFHRVCRDFLAGIEEEIPGVLNAPVSAA